MLDMTRLGGNMEVNARGIIDSGVGLALVGGLIAWGSSQAVQEQLVEDVTNLKRIVTAQVINTKDIEYLKEKQKVQLQILNTIAKSLTGNNK